MPKAITRANRRIYDALAEPLADAHRRRLDDRSSAGQRQDDLLAWCARSPPSQISRHMLEQIERLKAWQHRSAYRIEGCSPEPPAQIAARASDDTRRLANSSRTALALSWRWATEAWPPHRRIIDLHDRILGKRLTLPRISISSSSRRQAGHQRQGTSVRAHRSGADRRQASGPRCVAAIEAVMSGFLAEERHEAQKLAHPMTSISCIASARATPPCAAMHEFLCVLKLRARPPPKRA
nr:Mobile element protein [Escherichia coli]